MITGVNGPGGFVTNAELRQHLDRLDGRVPARGLMKSVPETVGADVRIRQTYSLFDLLNPLGRSANRHQESNEPT
jgi:hypothetical protein